MAKARCRLWLSRDLLNPLSNSWTNIVSGINRCLQKARSFEAFKQLPLGLISEAKRKSLPAIGTVTGLEDVLKVKASKKSCESSDHDTNHRYVDKSLGSLR